MKTIENGQLSLFGDDVIEGAVAERGPLAESPPWERLCRQIARIYDARHEPFLLLCAAGFGLGAALVIGISDQELVASLQF